MLLSVYSELRSPAPDFRGPGKGRRGCPVFLRAFLLFLLLFFSLFHAMGEAKAFEALERDDNGPFLVAEIIDGDTLRLQDGRQVRFVGIQAPKLPLGRKGFKAWPLAAEAKEVVESLLLGREVELAYGGRRQDRHGRILAQLFLSRADGSLAKENWVQGQILSAGLARVYSFSDNRALISRMLLREEEARLAARGIWGHSFYRILSVSAVERSERRLLNRFAVVEGEVRSVATLRGRGYVNFGEDWREDFTLSLDRAALKLFKAEGVDLVAYEGRRLRARGWIKSFNGPMIEITHPEQIEVLTE